jgi:hypothetical protein
MLMAIRNHGMGNYLKNLGLNHPIKEGKLLTTTHVMNREYYATCHDDEEIL